MGERRVRANSQDGNIQPPINGEETMPAVVAKPRLAVAGLALALAACSSTPPPSLTQAQGEVHQAMNAPPDSYSRPQLDEARLKVSQAENAQQSGDDHAADQLSQEAMADLQLSRSLADAQKAQKAANDMQSTINALQHEAAPPTPAPPGPSGR